MNYKFCRQHTVSSEVWCKGIGLHSGAKVSMRLKPAPVNYGVRFRRVDLTGSPTIIAHFHHVVDTVLATRIGFNGVTIATVEHLMAALLGSGIDNVLVELNGPEVPIFDGSAAHYIALIQEAGRQEQALPPQYLRIEKPFFVSEGDAFIKATPSERFQVRYTIDFPHRLVGRQEYTWFLDSHAFHREIARARTFGFLKDVEKLQSMGLAQGGSLDNAVVFDDYNVLNREGFRYSNECVRHKILDFIGDLALTGMRLQGNFEVHKAGHALHNRFLKQLMTKPGYYAVQAPAAAPPTYFPPASLPGFMDSLQHVVKPL